MCKTDERKCSLDIVKADDYNFSKNNIEEAIEKLKQIANDKNIIMMWGKLIFLEEKRIK